jgi:SAM-dependent methyltransferase
MSLLSPALRDRGGRRGSPRGSRGGRSDRDRAASAGLRRSWRLFRLFLVEQTDPELFYSHLAEDAIAQVAEHCALAGWTLDGRVVVDVGGGGGWVTEAFRARGADSYLFEPDITELRSRDGKPGSAVVADGYWLPVRDGAADVAFSSNVLEHVPDPMGLIEEMIRVTRPGGLVYLSYTNWYSPWGGHEMSPWHYLGAGYAERRYVHRHQKLPKNRYGVSLFPLHIGPLLRQVRARKDIEIVVARPRYYPAWCGALLRLPLLREVLTWNLMLIVRRVE